MIGIRVDGNSKIGTGHVMRCLAIANELNKIHVPFVFILADEQPQPLMEHVGYKTVILHSLYDSMMDEIPVLKKIIQEYTIELLLLDTYQATSEYFVEIQKMVKIAYMDDLFQHTKDADIIINYNLYGTQMGYVQSNHMLLGTNFVPLREEFQKIIYIPEKIVRNVLISTGGSDQFFIAGQLLECLETHKHAKELAFHVVSGKLNPHRAMLEKIAETYGNVMIHQGVEKMSELMKLCDLAISAGGSTMYELCAVGVPIICFSYADNQELLVEHFVRGQYAFYGGNYLEGKDLFLEKIEQTFWRAIDDYEMRKQMSEHCKALVDGYGAMKIAVSLKEHLKKCMDEEMNNSGEKKKITETWNNFIF